MKNTLVFKNRKVYFDFEILEKIEAGIMLTGTEIKSVRNGKVNINGSFGVFIDNELYIKGINIAIYDEGSYNNHDPKRDRKLLMHKKELVKLKAKTDEKGFGLIPLRLYPNERNIFKVEIALAKGRKKADKRSYLKEREVKREMKDAMGN